MRVVIAWWDLEFSTQTIESLRHFLRDEAVDQWADIHGLRLKLWIADREHNRWGAVQIWQDAAAADQPLPTRAGQIIGYPPTFRQSFEVEATVEGVHSMTGWAQLAAALRNEPDGHETDI
jgi:hypothetical protein